MLLRGEHSHNFWLHHASTYSEGPSHLSRNRNDTTSTPVTTCWRRYETPQQVDQSVDQLNLQFPLLFPLDYVKSSYIFSHLNFYGDIRCTWPFGAFHHFPNEAYDLFLEAKVVFDPQGVVNVDQHERIELA